MEQLLKEILESYDLVMKNRPYTFDRGKGTRGYCQSRIKVLRSQLLEMLREIDKHYQ